MPTIVFGARIVLELGEMRDRSFHRFRRSGLSTVTEEVALTIIIISDPILTFGGKAKHLRRPKKPSVILLLFHLIRR